MSRRVAAPQPLPVPLTTGETAKILGKSRGTVLRWVKDGHIKPLRGLPGAGLLFAADEVERVQQAGPPPSLNRKHRPCQCRDCIRVSA